MTLSENLSRWTPGARRSIIQDMQNDVIIEGGAFADSGAPAHATRRTSSPTSPTSPPRAAPPACR